jgi:hypothetical protein
MITVINQRNRSAKASIDALQQKIAGNGKISLKEASQHNKPIKANSFDWFPFIKQLAITEHPCSYCPPIGHLHRFESTSLQTEIQFKNWPDGSPRSGRSGTWENGRHCSVTAADPPMLA